MATNELLPFANGEDANVLPTAQWQALTDILENGFQSGIAKSEQVNRVLAQGAVASYVLGQLIVDQLNQNATLDETTLYQNIVKALQENAKDVCLPLSGGTMTGDISFPQGGVFSGGQEILFSGSPERSLEWQYPVIGLRNGNHGNPFSFVIAARNASVGNYLEGSVDGRLTWNDKTVVCVESWSSGDSWYRKYSDGWIEQGGLFNGYNGQRVVTVPFHTPFVYQPNVQKTIITTSPIYNEPLSTEGLYSRPTTTGFQVEYVYGESDWFFWKACGY